MRITVLACPRRRRHARWTRRLDDLNTRQRLGTLNVGEFMELRDLERASQPDVSQLRDLRARRNVGLDARMTAELGRARRFLREAPRQDGLGMPTRLGDILRATERRPADKYGLDTVVLVRPVARAARRRQDRTRPGPVGAGPGHAYLAVGRAVRRLDALDVPKSALSTTGTLLRNSRVSPPYGPWLATML
ncbi:hypothetical protein ACFU8W_36025 [Streptomyces sp. NPDC057565]|uniref:hypothetical protein n=1 Tax=Streptomyces sp. NPDC057565 TaxID=3346169 RepID=UPI0036A81A10